MMRVAPQLDLWQQLLPVRIVTRNFSLAYAGINRGMRRKVAGEVARVDIESVDHTRGAQPKDDVVMSRFTFPPALPTIHPFAVIVVFVGNENRIGWIDEPGFIRKKIVGRKNDACAEPGLFKPRPLMKRIVFFSAQVSDSCKRIRAILCISLMAASNSVCLSLFSLLAKAASMSCRLLPRTAMTNGKPNLSLYCAFSS